MVRTLNMLTLKEKAIELGRAAKAIDLRTVGSEERTLVKAARELAAKIAKL